MRKYHFILAVIIFISVFHRQLSAHPHLFIDVGMKFMLNDSGLSSINISWYIDEMNSAQIIDYYDANKSGIFEKKELIQILKVTLPTIQDMTTITWGVKYVDVQRIEKFNAIIKNKNIVVYSFVIPCHILFKGIPDKKITVYFDDPSIFTAFTLKKDLIQSSSNKSFAGTVSFGRLDYIDTVILHLKRR